MRGRLAALEHERFDFVVVGSGIAGLAYALEASKHGTVAVLTKAEVTESNTTYAQGGIAAAVGEADNWKLHEEDTLIAGAGLCDPQAVRFLVQSAPAAVEWLARMGARFDLGADESYALGREGGHSMSRIVHHQDKTGWEIERAVSTTVRQNENIRVFEHTFATHLAMAGGRCVGVQAQVDVVGQRLFLARAVLLATGGCGVMYQHSTNPRVATADGIALASEAGARIDGMEFMQFHPTTFYHPQARGFLVTEAVRGAGGTLRNHLGSRFMVDVDERLELAPRDIVARAIDAEMKRLDTWCVYLDIAHQPRAEIEAKFPTIFKRLQEHGVLMHRDWIPVVPAQHYSCGGVVTDLNGQTTVPGLYAAGEVAQTGVHGANRLASNSLIEAIVFGLAAARASKDEVSNGHVEPLPVKCVPENEAIRIRRQLQKTMTDHAGIVRTTAGLREAAESLEHLLREYDALPDAPFSVYCSETRNLLVAAGYVVRGALARDRNVGLHYNADLAATS